MSTTTTYRATIATECNGSITSVGPVRVWRDDADGIRYSYANLEGRVTPEELASGRVTVRTIA